MFFFVQQFSGCNMCLTFVTGRFLVFDDFGLDRYSAPGSAHEFGGLSHSVFEGNPAFFVFDLDDLIQNRIWRYASSRK